LVLVFYSRDRAMAYRNTAVREKAVIRNYQGMNIGYTEQVGFSCNSLIQKHEGDWDNRVCIGVMKFANTTLTRRWLESDHPFRQPDFLGQVDIILVPLQKNDMSHKGNNCAIMYPTTFEPGYPILEITSLHVSFKDLYETKYLPELECLVQRFGGVPLVVCQNEPWIWRAVENPGAIIINQWPNWDSYEKYCARGESFRFLDSNLGILSSP
uniref:Exostosin domain-containing protein n=1 Tax=Echinostoma caproni TaxID=27848 RepID=A0A183AH85_9TREM